MFLGLFKATPGLILVAANLGSQRGHLNRPPGPTQAATNCIELCSSDQVILACHRQCISWFAWEPLQIGTHNSTPRGQPQTTSKHYQISSKCGPSKRLLSTGTRAHLGKSDSERSATTHKLLSFVHSHISQSFSLRVNFTH